MIHGILVATLALLYRYPNTVFSTLSLAPTPSQTNPVHVIQPNGGERIPAGSVYTITWSVEPGTANFGQNIFLSTDGGDTFEFESINPRMLDPTARSYDWQVPRNLETTRARIMVFVLNPSVFLFDTSDANFTIFTPIIPPVQENITTRGGGSLNRLTIRVAGARLTSPVTGSMDIAFSPSDDPAKLSAQINAFSFVGESISIGQKPTGQLLFAKEHSTFAGGSYDLATGNFSIPISVALIFDELLSEPRTVLSEDQDVRNSPRPVIFSGLLTGRRNQALGLGNGTLEGTIQDDVPLLKGAMVTIDWSGRLTASTPRLPTASCPTFCIDAKVIADDTAGTAAVITPAMIQTSLTAVNAIWGQGAIQFTLRDADPAMPGTQVTFIPANLMVTDPNGRVLTDGDFRHVTDQGEGLTDEQVALTSRSRDEACIDVYFVNQLVSSIGRLAPTGITVNGGMRSTAIILGTSGSGESTLAAALAHQLGHVLGLPHDAVPNSNLMFAEGIGGMNLNASQCLTAGMTNPLVMRTSCQDREFDPQGVDVIITGLGEVDTVARGGSLTTTITGRGLADTQSVGFPPASGVTAEILGSSTSSLQLRVSAANDAQVGPLRFWVSTSHGTASSGVFTFKVR